jgi:hypothetical protein
MSRITLKSLASLALAGALAAPQVLSAQDPTPPASAQTEPQQLFTIEELDNLLARVALYPDPILAQLLVAATYPDQIALAARYVRTYGKEGIDNQAWDVSVKAIAYYPPVLNMLDEDPDWTTALGQAYAIQEGDVMAAVQGLRKMAQAQGNLVSTAEQTVEVEQDNIRIIPAQPRVIYVPTYDPYVVYYRPVHYHYDPYWSFGVAFPIGVWLTYDFDWGHRVVYYHGWNGYGHGHTWYHVSRPFIYINSIYVNPWRTVVVVNRRVVHRYVDYRRFDRYNGIHRRVSWDRNGLPGRYDGDRAVAENRGRTATPRGQVTRGETTRGQVNRGETTRGQVNRAETTRGQVNRTEATRGQVNRVKPIPTRTRGEASDETRGSTAREPRDNGTWNARPSTTTTRTAPRTSTSTTTRAAPRTTTSRGVAVERSTRTSTSTSAPRSMPQRASAPQRTSSAPQRASSPQRTSSPQRQSAPRASAPSRGSGASAPSRGSSSGRSSAPARSEGRGRKGSE